MEKPKILLQLDSDPHASVFDAVVAIDSGVDQLLTRSDVQEDDVRDLVHGAMFTRGGDDLRHSAVFVGGSDVAAGEKLLAAVQAAFFGPVRVSAMLDSSGANTTAVAAVLAAARHVELAGATALVLAATGPVGRRVARLLAKQGASVRVGSRTAQRAEQVVASIRQSMPDANLAAQETVTPEGLQAALDGAAVVISAGAPGVELLPGKLRQPAGALRVAIDLSAVPPAGIEGIEAQDKAAERDGAICYGALGVGSTKMKIHKAAIQKLFTANDLVLDADEIYALGESLERS